ncbi:recombinase family protein [Bradyrhizobium diazoefficiens]|uniref:recombinase family protein n=1 Tax=Bradyrhizobium diazoefficiens TaxID=1355477 RepID=UPI003D32004C
MKRHYGEPWFQPVARYGTIDSEVDFLEPDPDPGVKAISENVTPRVPGELFFYLNDAVVPVPDVKAAKIDVIVVYKIDRFSRSMLDFLNLVELFECQGVTFVSVTQSFNTKDAMGRMALNILVTFAQFERELIGERIRDKVAASRKRGKWMGGWTPLGYEVRDRKLLIDDADAERVRAIFRRFVQLKSATLLARELVAAGERNRYGHLLDKGVLYKMLNNRVYIGDAVHKGTAYPGEHEPIIDRSLWNQVHAILKVSPRKRAGNARAQTPALLKRAGPANSDSSLSGFSA